MENKSREALNSQSLVKNHFKPKKADASEGSEFVDDNAFDKEKFEDGDEANQNKHGGTLTETT